MSHHHDLIEKMLHPYINILSIDFHRYRNHVYRVYLHCLLIDSNESNAGKYAIAAVFHDIGLWTGKTFNYLPPSIATAATYLTDHLQPEWAEEISLMIDWHHKTTPYNGKFSNTVETFRKADWIDITLGVNSFGVSRQTIQRYRRELPLLGFHFFLARKAFRYFFNHPLHPLPMFK